MIIPRNYEFSDSTNLEITLSNHENIKNCETCFLNVLSEFSISEKKLFEIFDLKVGMELLKYHIMVYSNINIYIDYYNFEKWPLYLNLYEVEITCSRFFSMV